MKKISLIFLVFVSVFCFGQENVVKKNLPIIPLPKEIKISDGVFVLTSQTKIVVMADGFQPEIDYLNKYFKTNYDFELSIVKILPTDGNYIIITRPDFEAGWKENYDLTINENQIYFLAEGNAGLFYAIQTLVQILPLEKTPEIKIHPLNIF